MSTVIKNKTVINEKTSESHLYPLFVLFPHSYPVLQSVNLLEVSGSLPTLFSFSLSFSPFSPRSRLSASLCPSLSMRAFCLSSLPSGTYYYYYLSSSESFVITAAQSHTYQAERFHSRYGVHTQLDALCPPTLPDHVSYFHAIIAPYTFNTCLMSTYYRPDIVRDGVLNDKYGPSSLRHLYCT